MSTPALEAPSTRTSPETARPASPPTAAAAETGGRIGGQVLGVDGLAVSHAEITLAGSGVWPPRTTHTDAEGRFVLEDVPPGIYEVQARSEVGVAPPRRGLVIEAGHRAHLSFQFTRGMALRGQVVDAQTEQPISNAEIAVTQEELGVAPRITRTSSDGRFELLGVPETTHHITAHADGYVPIIAQEGTPGQALHLAMHAGAVLRGIVVDHQHHPVDGARLEIIGDTSDHQPIAMSGETRAFRADVFAQHERSATTLVVTEGEVPPIPLVPLSHDADGPALSVGSVGRSFTTGTDGLFAIDAVPSGYVQVIAHATGHAPGTSERIWVAPGQTRERISIVLSASGRVLGEIVDDTGAPVSASLVEHRSDMAPSPRITTSDGDGHFVLDDVIGAITIRVIPSGRGPVQLRVDLDPGEEERVRVVLPARGPTILGRVVDDRQRPVAHAEVRIESMAPGDIPPRVVQSDELGRFEVQDAPAGPWRALAAHADYAPATPIDFDTPTRLEITLRAGLDVTGQVVDGDRGEALEGARIILESTSAPVVVRETISDTDGRFAFPRTRAGQYRLRVDAADFVAASRQLEVRGRDSLEMDPIELASGATLEGDVVDSLGHVVVAARITIEAEAGAVTTDNRGHFVLDRLPEGSFMIHAHHPAAGAASRMILVRRSHDPAPVVLRLPERYDPSRDITTRALRHGVAAEVEAIEDGVRIATVVAGTRAAHAGLHERDLLRAVDGVPIESAEQATRLLRGADGVSAILDLERDREALRLRIPRETW